MAWDRAIKIRQFAWDTGLWSPKPPCKNAYHLKPHTGGPCAGQSQLVPKLSHQGAGTRAQREEASGSRSSCSGHPSRSPASWSGEELMEFLYSFQIPTHRTVVVVLHHCVSVAFYPAEMDLHRPSPPQHLLFLLIWAPISEKEGRGPWSGLCLGCPVALCFLSSDCWKTGVSYGGWEPLANTSCWLRSPLLGPLD